MSQVGCSCGWPATPCNDRVAGFIPCVKRLLSGSQARARTTDPSTSHVAAYKPRHLSENQRAVMLVMRTAGEPLLDEELIKEYTRLKKALRLPDQAESGIRTRRHELSSVGLLSQGEPKKMSTGSTGRTWTITTEGTST